MIARRQTDGLIITKFIVHIPCGRGSVLLWRRCTTLWTSGFIDDVRHGHNGRDAEIEDKVEQSEESSGTVVMPQPETSEEMSGESEEEVEHEQQQPEEITAQTETEMKQHKTSEEPSEDRVLEPLEEQQEQLTELPSEFTFTALRRTCSVSSSAGHVIW